MCEEPFLKAAKTGEDSFDFSRAFAGMKELCMRSDYVVANLETPLAGKDSVYTHEMYSFNTPDCFVEAIKDMGVSAVLTANNHCGDRGITGLKRTVKILEAKGLPHTGTFLEPKLNDPIKIEIYGNKLAFLSYTGSTNAPRTGFAFDEKNVNLLSTQTIRVNSSDPPIIRKAKKTIKAFVREENIIRLRKLLGKPPKKVSVDDLFNAEDINMHLQRIQTSIEKIKKEGYMVFVCPHMGGQFNLKPGRLSEYVMTELVHIGADAVIASHPHIVQKAELKAKTPCFFSIGNVSMSMSTLYILKDDLPEIGLMTHFYIEEQKIRKVTFSLLYISENANGYIFVRPMVDVINDSSEAVKKKLVEQAGIVVRRVRQDDATIDEIEDEFELYDFSESGDYYDIDFQTLDRG